MMDYEYVPAPDGNYWHNGERFDLPERFSYATPRTGKPPLTVEVTHRYVSFIRPGTSTSYEVSRTSYDMLVRLANSGAYVVEILDSGYGVGWTMRRKGQ